MLKISQSIPLFQYLYITDCVCVANRLWKNIIQQVAEFSKDCIVYSSCKVHHAISVSTTVTCTRIQSGTLWVWLFWSSVQKFVSESSARACMHTRMFVCVCVCTDSGAASLEGRVQNDYLKCRNLMSSKIFNLLIQIKVHWLWLLNSLFLLWTATPIMCTGCHKHSYATGLKEYQLIIILLLFTSVRQTQLSLH
jgi:hypothetical protein